MPEPLKEPRPSVLFVCSHSTRGSQIVAAFLELAGERGDPLVAQAMAEVGIDLTGRTPRQLTEHTVTASDIVVTASGAMPAPPCPDSGTTTGRWTMSRSRTWTACASYAPTSTPASNASPPTSHPRLSLPTTAVE
ncbi:low molecular weight phosphatase family protein [Streptomyces mirabilis]|uniref:arsenate-mycothiol transferase ArsC n=1 Tax=Streptomyces mirabilis TaxID=68239 RepID=UPI0021C0954F|nr:hypothetical protein [Streptomyces mirabilis]MCT9114285.1 hypothetical protein [Streptomyces mirabilis]